VGDFIVHDEFVPGTAAGAWAGGGHECAIGRHAAFAAQQCGLDQLCNLHVCMDLRANRQCPNGLDYREISHGKNSFRARKNGKM
jgi:hypothetical protein